MKNFFCLFLTVMSICPAFCQSTTTHNISKEDYEDLMRQSDSKKKAGIIMVSAGSAMLLTGVILMVDGIGTDYYTETDDLENESEAVAGLILSIAGIGVGVGSIPMFVKSHRIRKEATLSLHSTSMRIPVSNGRMVSIPQPQLTLTIPF
jgi:hypothetical protein